MSILTLLAEAEMSTTMVIAGVAAMLFVFFVFVGIWASRYQKGGPDEVLVVSGRRYFVTGADGKVHEAPFRLVRGGAFIWPVYEQALVLSLKPVALDLALPNLAARDGHSVEVVAKGQVKIKDDDASLLKAASNFAGKTAQQTGDIASQILESSLRALVSGWTTAEAFQRRGQLGNLWQESAQPRLSELGLELLSLSVRDVKATERA